MCLRNSFTLRPTVFVLLQAFAGLFYALKMSEGVCDSDTDVSPVGILLHSEKESNTPLLGLQ